jgi:DNA-binding MarR family transcriptional regulator
LESDQQNLGFLLAETTRLMRRAFQQQKNVNLTLAQARALIYVSRHEGVRQIELAEFLEVRPITLARLIDQLEGAGLVERRTDPEDRRVYRIYLTPDAAPRLVAIEEVATRVRAQAMLGFDQQEAAAFLSSLQKMHDNLNPKHWAEGK